MRHARSFAWSVAATAIAAISAGCAQTPMAPSPQEGLSPKIMAGMQRVWDPMVTGLKGNCFQCHEAAWIEDKGKFTGNTAWIEARRFRLFPQKTLPPAISYPDMEALVRFMANHYGPDSYHLRNEPDRDRYNELLTRGTIVEFSFSSKPDAPAPAR